MKRVLALAFACFAGASCGGGESAPAANTAKTPVASIEIVDVKALDAVLAKHRGRGVLLNFWAIWCQPCVAELPELVEVGRESKANGGDLVLVSYDLMVPGAARDDVRERVAKFAEKRKIDAQIVIYDAPDYEAINARFDLPGGVPATLAIDKDGKIVDVQNGAANKARFAEMMQKALGQ